MRRSRLTIIVSILCVIVAATVVKYYFDWADTRPTPLTRDLPQLEAALAASHWISPGLGPGNRDLRALYMVSFRSCPYCIAYETKEFARLQKAGVDTRVILVARRDSRGQPKSTPAERATVAELWRTRDWNLYQRWTSMPVSAWATSDALPPPADSDAERRAAVEAGRASVERLAAILSANGVELHYPALIYRRPDGAWRAFIGYDPQAAAAIRADLGVS